MPTPHIVCGCFHIAAAQLSIYDKGQMAPKASNVYYSAIYRKRLLTPDLHGGLNTETAQILYLFLPLQHFQWDLAALLH